MMEQRTAACLPARGLNAGRPQPGLAEATGDALVAPKDTTGCAHAYTRINSRPVARACASKTSSRAKFTAPPAGADTIRTVEAGVTRQKVMAAGPESRAWPTGYFPRCHLPSKMLV